MDNISSPLPKELKIIIPKIFKCKLLQYFSIHVNNQNYLLSVLNGIENGLCETKTYNRNQIKIVIGTTKNAQIDFKNIIVNINKIIKCLEISKINDFMFICDMEYIDKKCKLTELDQN
eukprot:517145_1